MANLTGYLQHKAIALHLISIVYGNGLQRYQIVFATHSFMIQRQLVPRSLPSPLVFILRFTHFIDTLIVPQSSS